MRVVALLVLVLVADSARASAIDEDEARIEALVRSEQVVRAEIRAHVQAQASAPSAPVAAKAIAPPVSALNDDDWLAKSVEQEGTLTFDDLSHGIGRRVIVTTTGQRVHRGTVVSANGRVLTLRVAQAGGGAIYTLRREQIVRIAPR